MSESSALNESGVVSPTRRTRLSSSLFAKNQSAGSISAAGESDVSPTHLARLSSSLFAKNHSSGSISEMGPTDQIYQQKHQQTSNVDTIAKNATDELLQFQEGQTIEDELQDLLSHVNDDDGSTSSEETIREVCIHSPFLSHFL